MEKPKPSPAQGTDFRAYTPGQAFKAHGFYDYGSAAPTFRLDKVDYTLTISSTGKVTGTSSDPAGKASLDGTYERETGKLWFTKAYGIANFWQVWMFWGRVSKCGTRVAGFWSTTEEYLDNQRVRRGRFGLWVADLGVDFETATFQLLLGSRNQLERLRAGPIDEALREKDGAVVGTKGL